MTKQQPKWRIQGEQLKSFRKSAGLSQTEAANEMKITNQYLSRLELGYQKGSQDTVSGLLKLYGRSWEDLKQTAGELVKIREQKFIDCMHVLYPDPIQRMKAYEMCDQFLQAVSDFIKE